MNETKQAKQAKQHYKHYKKDQRKTKQAKQHYKHYKKDQRKTKRGGEIIDSGGFGCVFYPALKCKNKQTRTKGISKLSDKKESLNEWAIYKKINSILKAIPNYKKYFLLEDITICEPDKLTDEDLTNFNKCYAVDSNIYNSSTINNHLNDFMIINMPHGGKNLDKIISNDLLSFRDVTMLLKTLVYKAIIPMNKLHIYHFDIKPSNILYKNNNLKLIDFGLLDFKDDKNSIPKILSLTLINWNAPFSNILFNPYIIMSVNLILKRYSSTKQRPTLKKLVHYFKIIYQNFDNYHNRKETTLPKIFNTFYKIKNKQPIDFEKLKVELICNYCSHIIFNFIDFEKYEFDQLKYFDTIYSKNVDLYGIINCYIPYVLSPHPNFSNHFKSKLIDVIFEYCYNYKYAIKVIPIEVFFDKLNKISN